MSIPIIIDNRVRENIFRVVEYAWKNIVPIAELSKSGELKEGMPAPAGDKKEHVVLIPQCFRVVFSIENQGEETIEEKPGLGMCRHLSMSINRPGRIPNPIAVDMVIEEFGFENPLYRCVVWVEGFGEKTFPAINVLEPVDHNARFHNEDTFKILEESCLSIFAPMLEENLIETIKKRRDMK